jgi:putative FmdB family regulatory protein
MPTYEYACTSESCKNTWEADQSIKDEPLDTCPQCNDKTAKRLISGASFVLKGEGWAAAGYTKPPGTPPAIGN